MRKMRISFLGRMLAMVLLPMIVLGAVLLAMMIISLSGVSKEWAAAGLEGIAYSVAASLDELNGEDFTQDENGIVSKGDYILSENYTLMDGVKEKSGIDVTIFYGDTGIATSLKDDAGSRMVGTSADEKVVEEVIEKGNTYIQYSLVINGSYYSACYIPLTNNDGTVVGMVFAGQERGKIYYYMQKTIYQSIALGLAILVICIITSVLAARSISRGIKMTGRAMVAMASGDLSNSMDGKLLQRTDEIGDMVRNMDDFQHKLSGIIDSIKHASATLLESGKELQEMSVVTEQSADEISQSAADIAAGSSQQAQEVSDASGHMNTMGGLISNIVSKVDQMEEDARNMKSADDYSLKNLQQLSESNNKTASAVDRIDKQIHVTNDAIQSINEAVAIITAIAEQTNLLSLNASIEAARAGEQGKGFAVVASEIQKLAEESNQSANDIKEVITEIISESNATLVVMEEVRTFVDEQMRCLEETEAQFKQLSTGISNVKNEASDIAEFSKECDVARTGISAVIDKLETISSSNVASTEETTSSMEELDATIAQVAEAAKQLETLAENLEDIISYFKLA